ncbi:hypothetical protein L1987_35779 [Smallanthus sonchifolius]|uniref:Uncharacterized protein n=1 Tax=Smallanthus sonchifolius TaxID=185202 RepID=A0ACB9HBE3_9ASTR|nr:hypothetical protein L1987_35779 [Smallanthus sonchifolius]
MPTSFNLPLLLLTLFMIAPYPLTTARPLTMDHREPATTPDLNLALPGFRPEIIRSDSVPCAISSSNGEFQLLKRFEAGNYGSLFLSALPKGPPVSPSGPSPRTNALNN